MVPKQTSIWNLYLEKVYFGLSVTLLGEKFQSGGFRACRGEATLVSGGN